MKVICQICKETIAETSRERLSLPLNGTMFDSPDPKHGWPAPFDPTLEWVDFKCPHGAHRPIILPDKILTDEGMIMIPVKQVEEEKVGKVLENYVKEVKCDVCDKRFTSTENMRRHKAIAHKSNKR